jgi:hypothetical protein
VRRGAPRHLEPHHVRNAPAALGVYELDGAVVFNS